MEVGEVRNTQEGRPFGAVQMTLTSPEHRPSRAQGQLCQASSRRGEGRILKLSGGIRTKLMKKATKLLYEMLEGRDGSQSSSSPQNLMRPDTWNILSIHTCLHRCYVETDWPKSKTPSLKCGGRVSWAAQRKESSLWSGGLGRRV